MSVCPFVCNTILHHQNKTFKCPQSVQWLWYKHLNASSQGRGSHKKSKTSALLMLWFSLDINPRLRRSSQILPWEVDLWSAPHLPLSPRNWHSQAHSLQFKWRLPYISLKTQWWMPPTYRHSPLPVSLLASYWWTRIRSVIFKTSRHGLIIILLRALLKKVLHNFPIAMSKNC